MAKKEEGVDKQRLGLYRGDAAIGGGKGHINCDRIGVGGMDGSSKLDSVAGSYYRLAALPVYAPHTSSRISALV